MTYEEWAATVERGVTINPEMAFVAGQRSGVDAAVPKAFAAGAASRDAEIAELVAALERIATTVASENESPIHAVKECLRIACEAIDKVRKP